VTLDSYFTLPVDSYRWDDPCATPGPTVEPTPTVLPAAGLADTGAGVTGLVGTAGGLLGSGALLLALSAFLRRREANSGA